MANLTTVKKWVLQIDVQKEWLEYKVDDNDGSKVKMLKCSVCGKFANKIKYCKNYNDALVRGVTSLSRMKLDNLRKHSKSDQHKKAIELQKRPENLHRLYSTPTGRGFRNAEKEEIERVKKLIDIAYLIAKEEKPMTMFKPLAELEKRHGVQLGSSYINDKKAAEFFQLHSSGS